MAALLRALAVPTARRTRLRRIRLVLCVIVRNKDSAGQTGRRTLRLRVPRAPRVIVRHGPVVAVSRVAALAAVVKLRRGPPLRAPVATARVIPTVAAPTSRLSGEATATGRITTTRPMVEIAVATVSSLLTPRAAIRLRGPIPRPAAAILRPRVPTLRPPAAATVGAVIAAEATTAAPAGEEVTAAALAAAIAAAEGDRTAAAVEADRTVAVEVALTVVAVAVVRIANGRFSFLAKPEPGTGLPTAGRLKRPYKVLPFQPAWILRAGFFFFSRQAR